MSCPTDDIHDCFTTQKIAKITSVGGKNINPIIDAQNLSKVYNRTTVLDNISFQITPGETVALLKENGTGKSTLINLLNQLIQPNSGTTYVMGTQDVRKVRDKVGDCCNKTCHSIESPSTWIRYHNVYTTVHNTHLRPLIHPE